MIGDPSHLIEMADTLFDRGEREEALLLYDRALLLDPERVDAVAGKGLSLFWLGRHREAAELFRTLIPRLPDSRALAALFASSLISSGSPEEGIDALLSLMASIGQGDELLLQVARNCSDQGKHREANRILSSILARDPRNGEALLQMGILLITFCQFDDAYVALCRALEVMPDHPLCLNNLGRVCKLTGRIDEAIGFFRRGLAVAPDEPCLIDNYLFALNYSDRFTPGYVAAEHFRLAPRLSPDATLPPLQERAGQRIRIGYVSGDLYTHSVSYFLEPVLASHDRGRFHVTCYSLGATSDDTTERLRGMVDVWRDLRGITPEGLARIVREDRIDILVDLAGHTADNRLGTFALRAAPVQVSWIGYPATTGIPGMDYYLTDPLCDPPGKSDQFYSERLIRLPRIFCTYLPPVEFPPVTPPPVEQNGFVTFGSFNNFAKVTTSQLTLWSRLLKAVPGSRLLLKSLPLGSGSARDRLLSFFADQGVDPERVVTRGVIGKTADHLSLYGEVDVALDTFPYHGTTTTCEALWMGVPVVTREGKSHVSRVGVSLLRAVGLPELVARSEDGYLEICATLAGDPRRISWYREVLRGRMARSPLMDHAGVTREVETVFETMLGRKRDGSVE